MLTTVHSNPSANYIVRHIQHPSFNHIRHMHMHMHTACTIMPQPPCHLSPPTTSHTNHNLPHPPHAHAGTTTSTTTLPPRPARRNHPPTHQRQAIDATAGRVVHDAYPSLSAYRMVVCYTFATCGA